MTMPCGRNMYNFYRTKRHGEVGDGKWKASRYLHNSTLPKSSSFLSKNASEKFFGNYVARLKNAELCAEPHFIFSNPFHSSSSSPLKIHLLTEKLSVKKAAELLRLRSIEIQSVSVWAVVALKRIKWVSLVAKMKRE